MIHAHWSLHDIVLHRRASLVSAIKEYHGRTGKLLLIGNGESETQPFVQEASFYYMTGLTDPGLVMIIDLATEQGVLYEPHYGPERAEWMVSSHTDQTIDACIERRFLGQRLPTYSLPRFFNYDYYDRLIGDLQDAVHQGDTIFTLYHNKHAYECTYPRFILTRLANAIETFQEQIEDITPLLARMRRTKDAYEMSMLQRAIDITASAQKAAYTAIASYNNEKEVQAALEYEMTKAHASIAFPSIVGAGAHSTILHYHSNNAAIHVGDLVVVDIGARYQYYCADITRTYAASGSFNARQQEIYTLVADTQQYVASVAKPGYWLHNKHDPERSLHHLAKKFLAKYGYDHYFTHGIGHFLGLDVHDVGDVQEPLMPGDVFTIEPGIYIKDEAMGVRIEDNYYMTPQGVICLSTKIPQ